MTQPTTLEPRFNNTEQLSEWISHFQESFPTLKEAAEHAAAKIAGYSSISALFTHLEANSLAPAPNFCIEKPNDPNFSNGRLKHFAQDRMILCRDFGLTPHAANIFLTCYPPGAASYGHSFYSYGFDGPNAYELAIELRNEQYLEPIIYQHSKEAETMLLQNLQQRLGECLSPKVLIPLIRHLGLSLYPPANPFNMSDEVDLHTHYAGSVGDTQYGSVPVYALPFVITSYSDRDQVALDILRRINKKHSGTPVILFDNKPHIFTNDGVSLVVAGNVAYGNSVYPLFVPPVAMPFHELLRGCRAFGIHTNYHNLSDNDGALFGWIWSLMREANPQLPVEPELELLPNFRRRLVC